MTTYTVLPGDSLWRIAVKFQIGLSEIIAANPRLSNPDLIFPGQIINIPAIEREITAFENEVVRLVNAERARNGLPPLIQNWEVSRVARYKSQDFINRNYFGHDSPTYGSPSNMLRSFGILFSANAENIARSQTSPAAVMNSWMGSAGHRANILSPLYNQIGVGVARDSSGRLFWTQMFIRS